MKYVNFIATVFISMWLLGCRGNLDIKVDVCVLSDKELVCIKPDGSEYSLQFDEAINYVCHSPQDYKEIVKALIKCNQNCPSLEP